MPLLLLILLLPLAELLVMYVVCRAIAEHWGMGTGLLVTFGTIILTALVGGLLARRQGFRALRTLQETLQRGESPGPPLIDAALVVIGGALLILPGYLTDLLGASLLFPWTRRLYRHGLLRAFRSRLIRGEASFVHLSSPNPTEPPPPTAEDIVIDITPIEKAQEE